MGDLFGCVYRRWGSCSMPVGVHRRLPSIKVYLAVTPGAGGRRRRCLRKRREAEYRIADAFIRAGIPHAIAGGTRLLQPAVAEPLYRWQDNLVHSLPSDARNIPAINTRRINHP